MTHGLTCLRCGTPMEPGFVTEQNANHQVEQVNWVPGAPVAAFWSGLKVPKGSSIPVTSYRCVSCGMLESYALKE